MNARVRPTGELVPLRVRFVASQVSASRRVRSPDGFDDVAGGDAVAIEEFVGLAAAGNLADGEPVDVNPAPATASATASPMPPAA